METLILNFLAVKKYTGNSLTSVSIKAD